MPSPKLKAKNHFTDTQFLESYLYLFCIDMETEINHKRHYQHYLTGGEKGFTQNTLNAYIEAFNTPRFSLNISTVLRLHKLIAAHLETPGEFKTGANKFAVLGREIPNKITQASATEQGLKEFIDRWILNVPNPVHCLIISLVKSIDNPNYQGSLVGMMGVFNKGKETWFTHITPQGREQKRYEHEKHLQLIWTALTNPELACVVHSMPDNLIPEDLIASTSEFLVKLLIDTYNTKIDLCKSEQDKISCIVEFVQGVNQLHPFSDGNTRLSMLLLNRLLHTKGLSITLLANPNRLGMFSNAELVQCVTEGQAYFRDLCEGRVPSPYDKWIKEKNYQFLPCAIISTTDQMDLFINKVIQANYQIAYDKPMIYSLSYSSGLFYPLESSKKVKTTLATELSVPSLHWNNISEDIDGIRFVPELM